MPCATFRPAVKHYATKNEGLQCHWWQMAGKPIRDTFLWRCEMAHFFWRHGTCRVIESFLELREPVLCKPCNLSPEATFKLPTHSSWVFAFGLLGPFIWPRFGSNSFMNRNCSSDRYEYSFIAAHTLGTLNGASSFNQRFHKIFIKFPTKIFVPNLANHFL